MALPPEFPASRDDFQLTLHIQDDVRVLRDTGNLFLTNILTPPPPLERLGP